MAHSIGATWCQSGAATCEAISNWSGTSVAIEQPAYAVSRDGESEAGTRLKSGPSSGHGVFRGVTGRACVSGPAPFTWRRYFGALDASGRRDSMTAVVHRVVTSASPSSTFIYFGWIDVGLRKVIAPAGQRSAVDRCARANHRYRCASGRRARRRGPQAGGMCASACGVASAGTRHRGRRVEPPRSSRRSLMRQRLSHMLRAGCWYCDSYFAPRHSRQRKRAPPYSIRQRRLHEGQANQCRAPPKCMGVVVIGVSIRPRPGVRLVAIRRLGPAGERRSSSRASARRCAWRDDRAVARARLRARRADRRRRVCRSRSGYR